MKSSSNLWKLWLWSVNNNNNGRYLGQTENHDGLWRRCCNCVQLKGTKNIQNFWLRATKICAQFLVGCYLLLGFMINSQNITESNQIFWRLSIALLIQYIIFSWLHLTIAYFSVDCCCGTQNVPKFNENQLNIWGIVSYYLLKRYVGLIISCYWIIYRTYDGLNNHSWYRKQVFHIKP